MAKQKKQEKGRDGLTIEQRQRIYAVKEQMAVLDTEARRIVNATDEEWLNLTEQYLDWRHEELAETMAESWGSWEDVLHDRVAAKEDSEEKQARGDAH